MALSPERIGQRSKEANLQRSPKARAKNRKHLGRIQVAGKVAWSKQCDGFTAKVLPLAEQLRKRRSLQSVAAELNKRGILTQTGKPWTMANVDRLLSKGRKTISEKIPKIRK